MTIRPLVPFLLACCIAAPALAGDEPDPARQRARIDAMAQQTLDKLFEKNPAARELYDKAAGYAVFDNLKIAFGVSGGGGIGVAVDRASGERTYMRMGSAGIGFGLGGQRYQTIFFFETKAAFRRFVDKGWRANVGASAAAGEKGVNASASFHSGVALFRLTEKGLLANADLNGVKFWKAKRLNAR